MRTMTLLQANPGTAEKFKEWLLGEFAPAQSGFRDLIVNIAVDMPSGLELYGSAEADAGAHYDAVLEASCDSPCDFNNLLSAMRSAAPVALSLAHAYSVETHTVLHRAGFEPGLPTPGFKLVRGLYLYDDLPDAAAKRMWAHHSNLATKVHIGLSRYARHWVNGRITADTPPIRGLSDLHFPDEESMRTRYFDSVRGREEIIHDLGHFIASGTNRVFTKEYVF